jgi:enamine deaminase RidA (YjgF/YER057c/UK114 family)
MTTPQGASARLAALGLVLPEPARPSFDYVPVTRHGDLLFVSGQLPKEEGEVRIRGRVGEEVDLESARHAARVCVLQGLACVADHVGGIDRVSAILRVTGYVAGAPDFHEQPRVLDAASGLLHEIFGENGRHARSAVGVAALPRRAPVEIELIVSVDEGAIQGRYP